MYFGEIKVGVIVAVLARLPSFSLFLTSPSDYFILTPPFYYKTSQPHHHHGCFLQASWS